MALYDSVAPLELEVESLHTDVQEIRVTEEFPRRTTTVTLRGADAAGKGEDVIYDTPLHVYPESLEAQLTGEFRFDEFSSNLGSRDLFAAGFEGDATQAAYRRWALESAALDLALKQNGQTFGETLGREYDPLRFVVSPSTDAHVLEELQALIDRIPGIEFKLDAKAEWNADLVASLASLDRVRVVDFKSHYEDFGRDPDYELYRTVAEGFEDAVLEDPKLTPETRPAFDGHEHRIGWDKPITGVESLERLPVRPAYLNVKPSRFGSVETLLDTIEYCRRCGIRMYGGGQFELDVGRQQIQAVASLFYPDAPNDVAPRCYNDDAVPADAPTSPLQPVNDLEGFRWRYSDSGRCSESDDRPGETTST